MWRNFRFVHFCPVEKCKRIMTDMEKSKKFSTLHICQMWKVSDFSTSVMWRNLTFLTWQMWRIFRFFHICYVWESNISPHDKFFSTYLICELCDKYEVYHHHHHHHLDLCDGEHVDDFDEPPCHHPPVKCTLVHIKFQICVAVAVVWLIWKQLRAIPSLYGRIIHKLMCS